MIAAVIRCPPEKTTLSIGTCFSLAYCLGLRMRSPNEAWTPPATLYRPSVTSACPVGGTTPLLINSRRKPSKAACLSAWANWRRCFRMSTFSPPKTGTSNGTSDSRSAKVSWCQARSTT
ncbi:hypothetical protein D3C78_1545310 [compost metagenome]